MGGLPERDDASEAEEEVDSDRARFFVVLVVGLVAMVEEELATMGAKGSERREPVTERRELASLSLREVTRC